MGNKMRFSRQAELSINLLVVCANHTGSQFVTTRVAAQQMGTSKDFAARIAATLMGYGYLEGQRGKGGGIRLLRPADSINVREILEIMQPGLSNVPRIKNNSLSQLTFENLNSVAIYSMMSFFERFTIEDIASC